MLFIGLSLGGEVSRFTLLDAAGDVVEEGVVRSTEADLRQRFEALPPSLICVQYDARYASLLALLSDFGHSLLLSGPVPDAMRPALLPAVERFAEQGRKHGAAPRSVVLRKAGDGVGLSFWVDLDADPGSTVYFIGPLPAGTNLGAAELDAFEAAAEVASMDQARRLHALWSMGEVLSGQLETVAAA